MQHHKFTFNPFQENTYVLYDETGEAAVIDPGCLNHAERTALTEFIADERLSVKLLLNTHAHLDHVFGNAFVSRTYGVPVCLHPLDVPTLRAAKIIAENYGVPGFEETEAGILLKEGETVSFGTTVLEVLFVPGHAPGHVAFYHRESKKCFSGDVLFRGSIGRTDFPGCSHETLMESIHSQLVPLGEDVQIFSGHGSPTTIGQELRSNPYL